MFVSDSASFRQVYYCNHVLGSSTKPCYDLLKTTKKPSVFLFLSCYEAGLALLDWYVVAPFREQVPIPKGNIIFDYTQRQRRSGILFGISRIHSRDILIIIFGLYLEVVPIVYYGSSFYSESNEEKK